MTVMIGVDPGRAVESRRWRSMVIIVGLASDWVRASVRQVDELLGSAEKRWLRRLVADAGREDGSGRSKRGRQRKPA